MLRTMRASVAVFMGLNDTCCATSLLWVKLVDSAFSLLKCGSYLRLNSGDDVPSKGTCLPPPLTSLLLYM